MSTRAAQTCAEHAGSPWCFRVSGLYQRHELPIYAPVGTIVTLIDLRSDWHHASDSYQVVRQSETHRGSGWRKREGCLPPLHPLLPQFSDTLEEVKS